MLQAPGSMSADLALEILQSGPQSAGEICRRTLALSGLPGALAERLCETLLGGDPRFVRLVDGRWAAADSLAKKVQTLESLTFVVVDVETTGFCPPADRVIELGCVRVESGRITAEFETLINPRRPVPGPITSLTGISWSMLEDKPVFGQVCPRFLEFLGDSVFVAHNAPFDWRFIQSEVRLAAGLRLLNPCLCTRALARRFLPELQRRSLDELAYYFNLEFRGRHRALGDAQVTAQVLLRLLGRAAERGIADLETLLERLRPLRKKGRTQENLKRAPVSSD